MNCSENMAADEKDRFIQYLVDKVNTYELDKRATKLAVEESQSTFDSVSASFKSLMKEMAEIKAELREEFSKRKKAEANNVIKYDILNISINFLFYEFIV